MPGQGGGLGIIPLSQFIFGRQTNKKSSASKTCICLSVFAHVCPCACGWQICCFTHIVVVVFSPDWNSRFEIRKRWRVICTRALSWCWMRRRPRSEACRMLSASCIRQMRKGDTGQRTLLELILWFSGITGQRCYYTIVSSFAVYLFTDNYAQRVNQLNEVIALVAHFCFSSSAQSCEIWVYDCQTQAVACCSFTSLLCVFRHWGPQRLEGLIHHGCLRIWLCYLPCGQ